MACLDIFKLSHCLFLLKAMVEIASFICVCILGRYSSNNPFESHIIGDLNNYFYGIEENISLNYFNNKYNSVKIKSFFKTKKSFQKNFKNSFLRKLVSQSFCLEIQENFVKFKGTPLANIFDLKFKTIYRMSLAIIFIALASYLLYLFLIMFTRWRRASFGCSICWARLFAFVLVILYITKFILSIILYFFMERSDIEKYDDFLECKNVRKKKFDKFSRVNDLRIGFYAFIILNIIIQGIEQIEKCMDCGEKTRDDFESYPKSKEIDKYYNVFDFLYPYSLD